MKLQSRPTVRFERAELRALARRERWVALWNRTSFWGFAALGFVVGWMLVGLIRFGQWH